MQAQGFSGPSFGLGGGETGITKPKDRTGEAMGDNARSTELPERLWWENGRGYHEFRRGAYMYPCDPVELERLDLVHTIFRMIRDRQCLRPESISTQLSLFRAPLRAEPERVLDLGTGSGFWAIEVADMFERANVIGVDLANIQPQEMPVNVKFLVKKDFEDRWSHGQDSFDLIHLRCLNGSVSSWTSLYQQVFNHLKPGQGWIEQAEINWQPRTEAGAIPELVQKWWDYLQDATNRSGKPLAYNSNTANELRARGFVDVEEQIVRLPLSEWMHTPEEIWLGRWGNLMFRESFEALSLAPFTRIYNWPAGDVKRFEQDVLPLISRREHQFYCTIHIIVGRRP